MDFSSAYDLINHEHFSIYPQALGPLASGVGIGLHSLQQDLLLFHPLFHSAGEDDEGDLIEFPNVRLAFFTNFLVILTLHDTWMSIIDLSRFFFLVLSHKIFVKRGIFFED